MSPKEADKIKRDMSNLIEDTIELLIAMDKKQFGFVTKETKDTAEKYKVATG